MKLIYKIEQKNCTLNNILQNNLKISSRLLYKLIKNNCISLNGKDCDTRSIASPNDIITINFDYSEDNSNIVPTEMDLNIVFEDDWLLIVNKPAGIATHPSVLHFSDSLCNGVRFYFDSIGLKKKVRPVNRLDLNTSGLVVFAKCEYIQECLIFQMKSNVFKKDYLAICDGIFEDKVGVIDLPIARKENSIIERCISEDGQISITHYEVLKEFDNFSLVKCSLETGRTHQIRVHMSNVGHPLIGDSLYGTDSNLIERQALHCYHICFSHPIFKNNLDFVCDLPDDFKSLVYI